MKKNLKIVSAAAAALLAVAPVAASAVSSVNAAAVTNIELGGTSAPAIKSDVTLSSNLKAVTKANAVLTDTTTGNTIARYNWDGKVSGSITASWAGQSYTGNLTPGESTVAVFLRNADTQSWNEVKKDSNGLYALEPGVKYYVEVPAVSFNFGTVNANKKNLSLSASNGMRLISGDKFVDKINFDTDANGAMVNPKGVEVLIPVTPVDTANADVVSFFERATGTNVNSGSIDVNAVNGSINVSSIMSAFNAKYSAHQLENGANAAANVTTTVADVTAQLQKAGIKVDSLGNIADAPKTLNLTFNAKSPANGAEVSMPVTVNVPNGKVSTPTESAVTKTVNHIAAIYDKDGNQLNLAKLRAYNAVSVFPTTVTIKGSKMYEIADAAGKRTGHFVKASNIDGVEKTVTKNSYVYTAYGKKVYKTSGKAVKMPKKGHRGSLRKVKAGEKVTVYGGSLFNKQFYRIGKNQYIKVANF